jgi:CheY-like chemotaxis protein
MGGRIWVESELGKGAKFIFTVGMKKSEGKFMRDENADNSGYDFSGHVVLVAEDIDINRDIISAILEDTGVGIDFAENGRQAVSMFINSPAKYDLILMDIQMPEMNGYDATKAIRSFNHPRAGAVPIVAMTANAFAEDAERSLAAGMDEHIGKPVTADVLYDTIAKYTA